MTGGLLATPVVVPSFFNPQQAPQQSYQYDPANAMSARKRKAEDDLPEDRDRMSFSPSPAPSSGINRSPQQRTISTPASRTFKRPRNSTIGRPLALPRLLETLSADDMRLVLNTICERHPEIGSEIITSAPRPSVQSALSVLRNYLAAFRASFPYGNKPTSDYTFNRVKPALMALLNALNDFTSNYLPPNETQVATSLNYLDEATNIVHELPNWDNFQHDRLKHETYEEMAKSWTIVIKEAAKRGGGIQLQVGEWDRKLAAHDATSGGRLKEAVAELRKWTGWFGAGMNTGMSEGNEQRLSVRDEILNGTYGINNPIHVGPW